MSVRVALVGLGKMGVSHLAILKSNPVVEVAAVCDSSGYFLDVLNKYTKMPVHTNYARMLKDVLLDAVVVATPTHLHTAMVAQALERGLHVFCEKPLCLDPDDSDRLARIAEQKNVVNQVGYNNRFVATYQEVARLLKERAIGEITHALVETYGPVVLHSRGATWRSRHDQGGGCLYDYAAHPINLANWLFGAPDVARGSVLRSIFSSGSDDAVCSTLLFRNGMSAQLSVNWSDESYRKFSMKVTLWGTRGKLFADRQEVQMFLREKGARGASEGWNVRYCTDLTEDIRFYVRGEEYTAQLDYFVRCIADPALPRMNSFAESARTDRTIAMIAADAKASGPARHDTR